MDVDRLLDESEEKPVGCCLAVVCGLVSLPNRKAIPKAVVLPNYLKGNAK